MKDQFLNLDAQVLFYRQDAASMKAGFVPVFVAQLLEDLPKVIVPGSELIQKFYTRFLPGRPGCIPSGVGAPFSRCQERLPFWRAVVPVNGSGDGAGPATGAARQMGHHIFVCPSIACAVTRPGIGV